jgi:hypothetical protein
MTVEVSPPEHVLTRSAAHDAPPLAAAPVEADVLASVRSRLTDVLSDQEVERRVHEALLAIGPVRVTTYLPILVERRVRQGLRVSA